MALKFCIIYPDNTIGTAYEYPLRGDMALMPVSELNKMGKLLNVPDVCTSPDGLYHVDPDTLSVNGAEPCVDELDNLYEHTIRQESLIDLLSSAVDDLILN